MEADSPLAFLSSVASVDELRRFFLGCCRQKRGAKSPLILDLPGLPPLSGAPEGP